jgi:predicted Fe-Mo cluster-binding NifX family protein
MSSTVVAIPVTPDGLVGPSWGRAPLVAVATVSDGAVTSWAEHDVRWDVLHDEGTEGGHHARVARFLIDNEVQVVAADHMGPPMVRMLGSMGIGVVLGAGGDAREVGVAAADVIASAQAGGSTDQGAKVQGQDAG